jgi:hypothetical protein
VKRVLLLVAVVAALAACGDDGGAADAPSTDGLGTATIEASAGPTIPSSSAPATTAPESTAAPRRPATDPLCEAAEVVRMADVDYQVRLGAGVQEALEDRNVEPLNEALAEVEEDGTLAALLDAYDDLFVLVAPEQQPNVTSIKAFTEEFFRGVSGLPNFGEIESYLSALEEDPEAQAANEAGRSLDSYVRAECGAGITASG